MPIAHGEGNYYAAPDVLAELENNRQVIFRYVDARREIGAASNPNGSLNSIAGICNRERNVVGLMPHPERASELSLGSDDGRTVLASAVKFFQGLKPSSPQPTSRTGMTVIDTAVLDRHGIKPDEYERIQHLLGRDPNLLELGLFSVMWSEHCSYKSSRVHLKTLPTTGTRVVQGPGENAGAVDIGDGMCAVFKIESHNHPSFIEPYQGAATGVGGIIRDIFTMGARPIALLNGCASARSIRRCARRIFEGVVAGIGGYGNSIGIPTVGGEIVFDEMYAAIRWSTSSASASRAPTTSSRVRRRARAIRCFTSAPRPDATASTARPWRRRSSTRSPRRSGPPCRSAIRSWKNC